MILDYAKKCERNMLLGTVLTLVLGMVLAFEPQNSIKIISGIIAGMFCLIGVVFLITFIKQNKMERMTSFSLVLGVILIGIGVFLFVNIESLVNFITLLIGIAVLIKSLFKVQFAINIKDLSDKWNINLIVGLIGCVLGVVLLFNPWDSAVLFLRIVGIILAVGSVAEIIEVVLVMKTLDDSKEVKFTEKHPVVAEKEILIEDDKNSKSTEEKED